jgi:hypothetical protein
LLPFFQKKQQTGVIVQDMSPKPQEDASKKEEAELVSIILDCISAYKSMDIKMLAMLSKELHDCLHKFMDKDETSYDNQNRIAGE